MVGTLTESYGDLLGALAVDRQRHSVAVGQKVLSQVALVPPALQADLVAVGVLCDVGYGHQATGLHALDGARFLRSLGFSSAVCYLVLHHSASTVKAEERGLDLAAFREFTSDQDLGSAHAVLWWADMTTGPDGRDVTVEGRLEVICARYGPDDVVTRFVERARPVLLAAGQSPAGSIQVPC